VGHLKSKMGILNQKGGNKMNDLKDYYVFPMSFDDSNFVIPKYDFKIDERSSRLLSYICKVVASKIDEVKKNGYIIIKFRTLQRELGLSSEVGNYNPGRNIKYPIQEAIRNVAIADQQENFVVTAHFKPRSPITFFLDNGYLKVKVKSKYLSVLAAKKYVGEV